MYLHANKLQSNECYRCGRMEMTADVCFLLRVEQREQCLHTPRWTQDVNRETAPEEANGRHI